MGYHLEQAYRYRAELGPVGAGAGLAREAAERLGAAGRRAFTRTDAPAGLNLVSRAISLLPPDDPLRVDLVPSLRVLQGWMDLSWADQVLTEAIEAAANTGDRGLGARALVQRGFLRLFIDPEVSAKELIELAEGAIAVFEELGDEVGLARAWRLTAQAHYLARRAGASVKALDIALEHARRADDRFEAREIIEWLCVALLLGPVPADEGARRCERLLGEIGGDPALEMGVLGALSHLMAIQGRKPQAEELLARGRGVMRQLGEWVWLFPVHAAFFALWEDDPAAAERELLPGYEMFKKVGERSHNFASVAVLLAQSAYAQGRYDDAERFRRECEETANPNDIDSQIRYRAIRAKLLARGGELEAGEALARQAVALAETSDFLLAHGDALMDLAEVLRLSERTAESEDAITKAVQLYEAKGSAVAAARARAVLDEQLR